MKKFEKYSDCIRFLFGLERAGIKYDLINIRKLLDFLGNPQNSFKSIHIAGTNGKGSVAAILNSILMEYQSIRVSEYKDEKLTHPGLRPPLSRGEITHPGLRPPLSRGEITHPGLRPPLSRGEITHPGLRPPLFPIESGSSTIGDRYNIGLYTSPHIIDFRERILVNGKYISKKFILDFTNRVSDFINTLDVSFFEVTTALAFEYFRYRKVEYAVVEAGLGGRLDSTNILKPILSVITGVSIDHTEYLGDSIESIAKEKAGIIKKNTPCVAGEVNEKIKNIFKSAAKKKSAEIFFAKSNVTIISRDTNGFIFDAESGKEKLKNIRFPIIGDFQTKNISTALKVLTILKQSLKIKYSKEIIKKGFENILSNSKLFGRFQIIGRKPYIVIDISHNTEALNNIKKNLGYAFFKNLYVIFGIMKDKNYIDCLKIIESLDGFVVLSKPKYKRALEPDILFQNIKKLNKFVIRNNIKESFDFIKKKIKREDLLLVTGSFFVVNDFLKASKMKLGK